MHGARVEVRRDRVVERRRVPGDKLKTTCTTLRTATVAAVRVQLGRIRGVLIAQEVGRIRG